MKEIRQVILLAAVLVPLLVSGEIYFREGLKWFTHVSTCGPGPDGEEPKPASGGSSYTIVKKYLNENNDSVLGLIDEGIDAEGNIRYQNILAQVKTEGDKVYYIPNRPDATDWLLMYDFGLKVGEGCYIYEAMGISGPNNPYPDRIYVKCLEVEIHPDYPELEIMWMHDEAQDAVSELMEAGAWLRGISDMRGVDWNHPVNYEGGGSRVYEVWQGDKTLFKFSDETWEKLWRKSWYYQSGLPSVEAAPLRIRMDGMTLTLTAARGTEQARIYTEQGTPVGSVALASGSPAQFQLPAPGVYIVNVGTISRKILAH